MPTLRRESGNTRVGARDPLLWVSLLVAFAVRGVPVVLYPEMALWRDESLHYAMSVVAANVEQSLLGHWPPGYEVFLGHIFRAAGPSLEAARWVQVGISALIVGLVYGIARRAGGRRAGRIAALLCALQPGLAAHSHYIYSETLFIALFTGAAYVWYRSPRPGRSEVVGAGVLFGLAALTRSVAFYFLPVWLGWLVLRRRWGELRRVALVAGVTLAVVLPWTIRNAIVFHDFILIDGTMGRTAWWAYNEAPLDLDLGPLQTAAWKNRSKCEDPIHPLREPIPRVPELRRLFPPAAEMEPRLAKRLNFDLSIARRYATLDLVAYQRCEVRNALAFVRAKPDIAARRLVHRAYTFWGPNSFFLRSVKWGSYAGGVLAVNTYRFWKIVVVTSFVGIALAAIFSLGRRDAPPIVEWVALLSVYFTGIHALSVASTRHRLPLVPFLIVLAALWLARPGRPETRPRAWAVGLVSALFLGLAFHYVRNVMP